MIPLLVLLLLLAPCAGRAEDSIAVETVATGFDRPLWAGTPRGIHDQLWIVEQGGKIWICNRSNGERQAQPFLDLTSKVTRAGNEQGLLAMAFSPDFASSGRYYVHYNDLDGQTCIVRYTSSDRRSTDPESGELLLRVPQPFRNHNGGWMDFGPDGMLYIALGDGGSGNDPQSHGQNLNSLLGKLLRIDVRPNSGYTVPSDNPFVNRPDTKGEIWAYGLRNPWRCSFDRMTGDLWIGDVGQNHWEEINFMPHGRGAGANYGWRLREGMVATPTDGVGGPAPAGSIEPVHIYAHGSGPQEGLSVTGGFLYRGAIRSLQGRYIFADYQLPHIWSFRLTDGKAVDFKDHSGAWLANGSPLTLISSFGEDSEGELLIVSLAGSVYRLAGH